MSVSPLDPIRAALGTLHFPPEVVLSHFRPRTLERGEYWVRSGDVARNLAFVAGGQLRHTRVTAEGKLLTRWATLPGQYAVLLPSFTQGTPAEDDVTATEITELHELDHRTWAELRQTYPQLQEFWAGQLEWLVGCFEARVWSLISGDAEARYRYMLERYPHFILGLPQRYLADMLGIAPRHLSRIRAKVARGEK